VTNNNNNNKGVTVNVKLHLLKAITTTF